MYTNPEIGHINRVQNMENINGKQQCFTHSNIWQQTGSYRRHLDLMALRLQALKIFREHSDKMLSVTGDNMVNIWPVAIIGSSEAKLRLGV